MKSIIKNFKFIFISISILTAFSSCFRDKELFDEYPYSPWENLQKIELDINGEIVDEKGNPVKDVLITANNKTATTDQNGVFVIKKSQQSPDFIYVKAEKKGFFNGARVIRGTKNGKNIIRITLVEQKNVAKLKSSVGGDVVVDGVKINFPANGYVDAAGKNYVGNVNVAAKYLDPTKIETAFQMPGDLRAANIQGQEKFLETFGMVFVELSDDNGNKLNLGNGGEAELSFEAKTSRKPSQIPLWHFDEKIGAWKEEGSTTLVNNRYVGKVSHFSCWNCDYPNEKVFATGRIVDENGNPLANVWVGLNLVGQPWGGHGLTDQNGVFMGCIPKGQDLELSVSYYYNYGCQSKIFSKPVGSFNADIDFKDIVVTLNTGAAVSTQTFTGAVLDCSNNKLKNGYVLAKLKGLNGYSKFVNLFADTAGIYTYTNVQGICTPAITGVDITAYDLVNKKTSVTKPYAINNGNNSLGLIEVCSTVTEFIDFKFGDSTFYSIAPQPVECYLDNDSTGAVVTKLLNIYFNQDKGSNKAIAFSVKVNSDPPVVGTYPMNIVYIFGILGNTTTVPPTAQAMNMTLTEVSLVSGQYIAGSISGSCSINGKIVNVSGSFKVKKV